MNEEIAFSLVVQTLRTASTLLRESRRLFRPFGISEAQFNVLNVIGPTAGGLSQTQLSEQLVVDRSNVTGLVDRMETAGWVRRREVPGDRRSYRVVLTASGKRLWKKAKGDYEAAVLTAVNTLSEARVRSGLDAMTALESAAKRFGRDSPRG